MIAIAITSILTFITFTLYCKNNGISSLFACLETNGFNGSVLDEIANVAMTLFLNSILFAVVIYKNYVSKPWNI